MSKDHTTSLNLYITLIVLMLTPKYKTQAKKYDTPAEAEINMFAPEKDAQACEL